MTRSFRLKREPLIPSPAELRRRHNARLAALAALILLAAGAAMAFSQRSGPPVWTAPAGFSRPAASFLPLSF